MWDVFSIENVVYPLKKEIFDISNFPMREKKYPNNE